LNEFPAFRAKNCSAEDAICFRIHDDLHQSGRFVALNGAVTMPIKQDEIIELLEKTPGVRDIKNGLTVLPVSPSDDRIRVVIANQIYRDPLFVNYSRVNPPIHVIVEHGHVTLIGIVTSQIDRQKAEAIAHMVPGVFSVDSQIRLASEVHGR